MRLSIRNSAKAVLATTILCLSSATPSLADRIDGEWCNAGKSMKIDGPTVVTPGGRVLQGNYGRHDFTYVVPPGEAGTGSTVEAVLMSDEEIQVTSATTSKPVIWRRCKVIS